VEDRFGDLDFPDIGRAAARELLAAADPPTAIIAINDMCALGVSASVRDAGLRVGEDVSVVGFDDIMLADLATPPLTTIRQPLPAMANVAFAHLRTGIEQDGSTTGASLLMRPELVVRASTAPVRSR
jgi:DNA-binding LacI/PurR family transcriptional regulator